METKRIDDYRPWDVYDELDRDRLRSGDLKEVKRNAVNTNGPKGDEKHEEGIREEESKVGILCIEEQGKPGINQVVRKKVRRRSKGNKRRSRSRAATEGAAKRGKARSQKEKIDAKRNEDPEGTSTEDGSGKKEGEKS